MTLGAEAVADMLVLVVLWFSVSVVVLKLDIDSDMSRNTVSSDVSSDISHGWPSQIDQVAIWLLVTLHLTGQLDVFSEEIQSLHSETASSTNLVPKVTVHAFSHFRGTTLQNSPAMSSLQSRNANAEQTSKPAGRNILIDWLLSAVIQSRSMG